MLRFIDLGRCPGWQFTVYSDIPALVPDHASVLIASVVADEHLCIGYNRRWEDYFAGDESEFTFSRLSGKGGMMYEKDVGMLRVWTPGSLIDPTALMKLTLSAVNEVVRTYVGDGATLHVHDNYTFIDGKKFAGVGWDLVNGKSNCVLCLNKDPVDFDRLRQVFRNKTFESSTDLGRYGIPDTIYRDIAGRLAARLELPCEASAFSPEELALVPALEHVHASQEWMRDAKRSDLRWEPW